MTHLFREVRLTLPMKPDIEIEASERISEVAAEAGMSQDKIDELRMAVIEASINALEHSQAKDQKIYLFISVFGGNDPEYIEVKIQDRGVGIPQESRVSAQSDSNVQVLQKRGWGLSIIQGLMDDLEIQCGPQGTVIAMTKYL